MNHANDDELRNVLREQPAHAEIVFAPFLDSLLEQDCTFNKDRALAWAMYHAACAEKPVND